MLLHVISIHWVTSDSSEPQENVVMEDNFYLIQQKLLHETSIKILTELYV